MRRAMRNLPAAAIPAERGRRRIAGALARSSVRERLVLALLLVERLTPVEAARALDCSVAEVERLHRQWIERARGALRRRGALRGSRAIARAALDSGSRSAA